MIRKESLCLLPKRKLRSRIGRIYQPGEPAAAEPWRDIRMHLRTTRTPLRVDPLFESITPDFPYNHFSFSVTNDSIIKKTYGSGNLPPAFAEAASRRQVAPLCQIPRKAGPFAAGPRGPLARRVKGGKEGFSLACPYNYGPISKYFVITARSLPCPRGASGIFMGFLLILCQM